MTTFPVDEPGHILYLVSLNPEPGYEDKYNRWYNTEHVPELLACPGFNGARRFHRIEGIDGSPEYLAIYDIADMSAFSSPEYQRLRKRTESELSPLAVEVRQHRSRDINAKYRVIFDATAEKG